MVEQPYEAEDVLQQLLADYPSLLAGDQDSAVRKRWLFVKRELGVAAEEDAPDRWSLDHLFLDEEGAPTLIEVKRSSDTRIRREVVGQMLDYAANGAELWGLEKILYCLRVPLPRMPMRLLARSPSPSPPRTTPERYWERVGVNLKAGKLRLIFVADVIPAELAVDRASSSTSRWSGPRSWRSRSASTLKREATVSRSCRGSSVIRKRPVRPRARVRPGGGRGGREAELFAAIREKNKDRTEIAERLILLYEWIKNEGARMSWGTGKTPSVSLYLGEDADPSKSNSMSVWISPRDISIAFGSLADRREEAEMARLAWLARKIPGVAPGPIEDLEARGSRMWPRMPPADVLATDKTLDRWSGSLPAGNPRGVSATNGDSRASPVSVEGSAFACTVRCGGTSARGYTLGTRDPRKQPQAIPASLAGDSQRRAKTPHSRSRPQRSVRLDKPEVTRSSPVRPTSRKPRYGGVFCFLGPHRGIGPIVWVSQRSG